MIDQLTRNNAIVAYFFLGPFLLLQRTGPSSDPFVRGHAKYASKIIGIAAIIFFLVLLLFQFIPNYVILNITVYDIFMMTFLSIMSFILLRGSYHAYKGISATEIHFTASIAPLQVQSLSTQYSEEDKIRISLSFLPFFGIFLSEKYPHQEIIFGRKFANLMLFVLFLVKFTNSELLAIVLVIFYIGISIFTVVNLFIRNTFLGINIYKKIPSYHELEAHVYAIIGSCWSFIKISFGGKKQTSYQELFSKRLQAVSTPIKNEFVFWTNPRIIAIPIVNCITIPLFLKSMYRSYRSAVIEGLFLTLYVVLIAIFVSPYNYSHWIFPIALPMITIFLQIPKNLAIRAPFTSIAVDIFGFLIRTKNTVQKMQQTTVGERYTFPADTFPADPVPAAPFPAAPFPAAPFPADPVPAAPFPADPVPAAPATRGDTTRNINSL